MEKIKEVFQRPVWEDDDKIEITGLDFKSLREFFMPYHEQLMILENIFAKNMNSGVIKVVYEDKEGNRLTEMEVKEIMDQINQKRIKDEEDKQKALRNKKDK